MLFILYYYTIVCTYLQLHTTTICSLYILCDRNNNCPFNITFWYTINYEKLIYDSVKYRNIYNHVIYNPYLWNNININNNNNDIDLNGWFSKFIRITKLLHIN